MLNIGKDREAINVLNVDQNQFQTWEEHYI